MIGGNDQGEPVCGPCAGTPALDRTCRECGRGGLGAVASAVHVTHPGHQPRHRARLALAADLPAPILADLTGISISTTERWPQGAKRDWAAHAGQRTADDRGGAGSQELTNPTR